VSEIWTVSEWELKARPKYYCHWYTRSRGLLFVILAESTEEWPYFGMWCLTLFYVWNIRRIRCYDWFLFTFELISGRINNPAERDITMILPNNYWPILPTSAKLRRKSCHWKLPGSHICFNAFLQLSNMTIVWISVMITTPVHFILGFGLLCLKDMLYLLM
jgi:hypothetical protein